MTIGTRTTSEYVQVHGFRRMARIALTTIITSIILLAVRGIAGPVAPLESFSAAPPWPPWFVQIDISPILAQLISWSAVLLGSVGLTTGLVAARMGWRPSPLRLIFGSVVAVIVLMTMPPVASGDPLYYAAYGRIAALGRSPYVTNPANLLPPTDPFKAVVGHYKEDPPSRYGPLSTLSEEVASELAGGSQGRTLFWLKVWNALAFLILVLVLDRLVCAHAARRVRIHLMWSVNPLMLFLVMADGHNDVLAAALGGTALFALRRTNWCQTLVAGGLLVLAAAVKASYALYAVGLAWAVRRPPRSLACLALGASAVFIPSYILFGRAGISATTFGLVGGEQPNLLWHDAAGILGLQHSIILINILGLVGCAILAVVLLWRMPPGPSDVPAVRPTLALALALLIVSPYQQGWYDTMIFPLIAVMAASKLDWITIAHTTVLGIASVPFFYPSLHASLIAVAERIGVDIFVTLGLIAVCVALVWLCFTGNWRLVMPSSETGTS